MSDVLGEVLFPPFTLALNSRFRNSGFQQGFSASEDQNSS
jgi:hypothetical protein